MASTTSTSAEWSSSGARQDLEKRAVEAVLAWETFDRSKNLRKLLTYVCCRYFEGRADEIKEYNIAVDALGRPADFDQKKDAIVRVEMHRLRKRLREYYAGPGAADPVRIVVAEKGYVPEFIHRPATRVLTGVSGTSPEEGSAPAGAPQKPATPENPGIRRWKPGFPIIGMVLAVAVVALVAFAVVRWRPQPAAGPRSDAPAPSDSSPAAAPAGTAAGDVRILAGRGPGGYTDRDGHVWEGDRYFRGGEAVSSRSDIVIRGFDRNLFAGMREGSFEYAIPLADGVYEAELFFAETLYGEGNPLGGGQASRLFDIEVNGTTRVERFDVLASAGIPNAADSMVLNDLRPGSDGLLHLGFRPVPGRKALVNAIWLRPGRPGSLQPIRIAAQAQAYRDAAGRWWLPDRYYLGGVQVLRPSFPNAREVPEVVKGERYGDFTYSIPVAPGSYTATLYFYEYWWGAGHPGGPGKRVFDVYCNFRPLLTAFDIVSESRDAYQPVAKIFHGLTPNRRGKLVFDFVAKENNALINAIEIVAEPAK